MTALAVALVLCCAMVCGTYLAKRRLDVLEADANVNADAVKDAVTQALLAKKTAERVAAEVEQLRASSTFRSMT